MNSKVTKPKVSVVTITYNQEDYIRQTLDSFVMQKTDFGFEVVVADDCSTDKTREIIKEYANKYPDVFRPILRKKNIGAIANSIDSLRAARGKYIALCEGDDYWTDPEKLQRQADFLDNNPDKTVCFHPVRVFFEKNNQKDLIYPDVKKYKSFKVKELLKGNFMQTNSVMYRRQDYKELPNNVLPLDWYLHLYHAKFGKIGYIDRVMSAYRRHEDGIWWDSHANKSQIWEKHGVSYLNLYIELLKIYGNKESHKEIIFTHIGNLLANVEGETLKKVTGQLFKNPDKTSKLLAYQANQLRKKDEEIIKKETHIRNLTARLTDKDKQLKAIKSSRLWKSRNKIAKYIGKDIV